MAFLSAEPRVPWERPFHPALPMPGWLLGVPVPGCPCQSGAPWPSAARSKLPATHSLRPPRSRPGAGSAHPPLPGPPLPLSVFSRESQFPKGPLAGGALAAREGRRGPYSSAWAGRDPRAARDRANAGLLAGRCAGQGPGVGGHPSPSPGRSGTVPAPGLGFVSREEVRMQGVAGRSERAGPLLPARGFAPVGEMALLVWGPHARSGSPGCCSASPARLRPR